MRKSKFQPFAAYDCMSVIRILRIVAEQDGDILRFVYRDTTRDYVQAYEVGVGQVAEPGNRTRYAIAENVNLATEFQRLKALALSYGATPEAIRLLGLIVPVSKQEEADMAEKLKAKGAPKSDAKAPKNADAEALKAAAKETPVGGKKTKAAAEPAEAPKKRGNPEALAKAREAGSASREANKAKKIKALKKPKDIEARDGSFRKQMLEDVLRAKTVGEFYELGKAKDLKYDAGCLKFAIENEYVSVG